MEEFTSFNLRKIEELKDPNQSNGNVFESELGPFNWHQDRLIHFGKSKQMFVFVLLLIVSYGLSVLSSLDIILAEEMIIENDFAQLGWAKFLSIVSLLIALLPVYGFTTIYLQSHKANKKGILHGLEIVSVFIAIMYILFAITVAAVVILFIFLLFQAFIMVVLLGAILGGLLYFYWKLLTYFNEFIKNCTHIMECRKEETTSSPDPSKVYNYFVGLLILTVIANIIRLFDINQLPFMISPVSALVRSSGYIIITLLISVLLQINILVLLNHFEDRFLGGVFMTQKKQEPYRYEGYEDMFKD